MWNMPSNFVQRQLVFFGSALLFLLFWSAYDYGGRYLHVQTLTQVMTGGLLLWCARRFHYPDSFQSIRDYPLLWPSLLWLTSACLSFAFSVNQLASLEEIARLLMYLCLSLCTYLWVQQFDTAEARKNALDYSARSLVGIGLIIVALGWLMQTQDHSLAGTFYRTNDLAGYLLLIIPLALGGLFNASQNHWRAYYGTSTLVLAVSLMSTNSRTSWLAMILSLALLLYVYRQQFLRKKTLGISILIIVLMIGGLAFNWESIGARLDTLTHLSILKENATSWRIHLLKDAWNMFLDRPVLGYGPNTYGIVLPQYMQEAGFYSVNPHNYYLQTLAETGLLGGLALLLWLGSLTRGLRQHLNPYTAALACGLLASLIHIGFDIDWSVSAIPLLFFSMAGLALSPVAKQMHAPISYTPYINISRVLVGLLGASLVLVPSLNYFSAQAYIASIRAQNQSNLKEAQTQIQKAIALAPWPSGKHHHTKATFFDEQKEPAQALVYSLKAIQIDPRNARYYSLPGKLILQDGDPKNDPQAADLFERRLQMNRYRHPSLYTELAEVYWRGLKRNKEAKNVYEQGLAAFSEADLARYEHYSPGDRYEVFMLLQGLAALEELSNPTEAETLHQRAQKLLKQSLPDGYILQGSPSPTHAIEKYWQAIEQSDSHSIQEVVHTEATFQHPPAGLFKTNILYKRAERDISDALLQYRLATTADAQSRGAPPFLWFETQLIADANGWKMIAHRQIPKSTVFIFESLW